MRLLASFVMRGRSQGVMAAAVLAILSLLLPPVTILSSAAIALVTLRKGAGEGGLLLVMASFACGLLALLLFGQPLTVAGYVLLMWLPVWLLALQLRFSRSLSQTMQLALFLGVVLVITQLLQSQDPVAEWRELLAPFVASLVDAGLVESGQQDGLLEAFASWMPGLVAAGFFLQSMVSLFVARWWQATLYNPGGFAEEFQQLRMHRLVAVATLLVVALQLFGDSGMMTSYLLVLLIAGWFLQGLALAHGIINKLGVSRGWLVGIYLLLMFAAPHMVTALAVAGFADAWIDFRTRLRAREAS